MTAVFLKLFNMSVSAGWLLAVVLMLRVAFKKMPKWITVLLWGVAAVRLVCPVSIESALSLIPSAEVLPNKVLSGPTFTVDTGIVPVDTQVNAYLDAHYFEGMTVPFDHGKTVMTVLAAIWLLGVLGVLVYMALSYWQLHRAVDTAVLLRDNIYRSEHVESPFILGIIRPRIYIPFAMNTGEQSYVLAHETAHIRRGDHLWKPLGALLLAVYWFNPLVWVAYILLCRDIELACDEKVIRKMEKQERADYLQTLLTCSSDRGKLRAYPLGFGEIGVKARAKSIMVYQKPALWMVCLSILFSTATAACFLTDPQTEVIAPTVPVSGRTWPRTWESGVLGCNCYVVDDLKNTHEVTGTFYIVTDKMAWTMLEIDYCSLCQRDLDGDRISELVANMLDAEGNRFACVFTQKGDTIYRGVFDTENLPDFYDYGPGAVWSEYDTSKSLFRIHYAQKETGEFAVLETRNLSLFRFEVYRVMPEDVFAYIIQGRK